MKRILLFWIWSTTAVVGCGANEDTAGSMSATGAGGNGSGLAGGGGSASGGSGAGAAGEGTPGVPRPLNMASVGIRCAEGTINTILHLTRPTVIPTVTKVGDCYSIPVQTKFEFLPASDYTFFLNGAPWSDPNTPVKETNTSGAIPFCESQTVGIEIAGVPPIGAFTAEMPPPADRKLSYPATLADENEITWAPETGPSTDWVVVSSNKFFHAVALCAAPVSKGKLSFPRSALVEVGTQLLSIPEIAIVTSRVVDAPGYGPVDVSVRRIVAYPMTWQ